MKVAKAIQSELLQYGISVQVARAARDLGLSLNPGGRRSAAGIQAKKLKSASVRLDRTAGLVKVVRGARKLVTTGSFPQALWGHVSQGIAPTVLDRFRTQVAAATGICQPGKCRTTAIALAFGQGSGPAVKVVREQVGSWLSLWEGCPELRGDVRVAWVFHSERVIGERGPDWHKITGPMTATIATLHNHGWKARCPVAWTGPDGCSRTINAVSGTKSVAGMVAGSVVDHLWEVASLFWCVGGLAEGGLTPRPPWGTIRTWCRLGTPLGGWPCSRPCSLGVTGLRRGVTMLNCLTLLSVNVVVTVRVMPFTFCGHALVIVT